MDGKAIWRRGWDSNPRYAKRTTVFETAPFDHSGTSPQSPARGPAAPYAAPRMVPARRQRPGARPGARKIGRRRCKRKPALPTAARTPARTPARTGARTGARTAAFRAGRRPRSRFPRRSRRCGRKKLHGGPCSGRKEHYMNNAASTAGRGRPDAAPETRARRRGPGDAGPGVSDNIPCSVYFFRIQTGLSKTGRQSGTGVCDGP